MPADGPAPFVEFLQFQAAPELAQALRSRVGPIMTRWEEAVCQLLPKADNLTFAQLRDDSLAILRQLADALASPDRAAMAALVESSRQHGGVRFQEHYNLQELITEYHVLRRTAMAEVESALQRSMSAMEHMILHTAIDAMLERGVLGFVAYQQSRLRAALASAQAAEAASQAKAQFLAVLSHELRTPLTPVLTLATMLRDQAHVDPDTHEQLEVICRNAELEARLIDDLLDVTRIERGKIELDKRPVALDAIVRHAAEVCRPSLETRKLELSIALCDPPCRVDGDPARLQQVFWNLLSNAGKFTPEGGRVAIRGRCEGPGEGGWAVVEVSDSGEGIDPDVLPHIFNAFEQGGRRTTRHFGGLGLGLTIAKAIIELHGGTIAAASPGKGQGATFTIRLPLLPAGSVLAPPPFGAPAAATSIRPLRILLVEDHGDTAGVMHRLLSTQGHTVEIAGDVAMALQRAADAPFDLILSDLGLPDGSGLDLIRTLRQRGFALPGIALSGYGQDQDVQESRAAGFAAHLTKPVNLAKLAEAMAKVVGDGPYADSKCPGR